MFAPTTDRSSSPRRYAIGSLPSALKRPTSSLANPWGNGYWQSFNSKLREELLNGEIFFSLAEAQVLIEAWRRPIQRRAARRPAGSVRRLRAIAITSRERLHTTA